MTETSALFRIAQENPEVKKAYFSFLGSLLGAIEKKPEVIEEIKIATKTLEKEYTNGSI